MNRFALIGLFVSASLATASSPEQREVLHPYAHLNTPSEATTAATGGLGVAVTDEIKSRTRILYSKSVPCGPRKEFPKASSSQPQAENSPGAPAGSSGIWLPIGVGASLTLVGLLRIRRAKV